jgi:hypothetical protein
MLRSWKSPITASTRCTTCTARHRLAAVLTRCSHVACRVHCGPPGSGSSRFDGLLIVWISTAVAVSTRGMTNPTGRPPSSSRPDGQVSTTKPLGCTRPGGGDSTIAATLSSLAASPLRSG